MHGFDERLHALEYQITQVISCAIYISFIINAALQTSIKVERVATFPRRHLLARMEGIVKNTGMRAHLRQLRGLYLGYIIIHVITDVKIT